MFFVRIRDIVVFLLDHRESFFSGVYQVYVQVVAAQCLDNTYLCLIGFLCSGDILTVEDCFQMVIGRIEQQSCHIFGKPGYIVIVETAGNSGDLYLTVLVAFYQGTAAKCVDEIVSVL